MKRTSLVAVAALAAACASSSSSAVVDTTPPPSPSPPSPSPPSAACAAPEFRQLDFWLGDWDLVVKARVAPESEEWATAAGTQHIEAILGGCVIAEHFTADGPGQPWAGKSYAMWQPQLGTWRQTWVDDAGSYLAFTGGVTDGTMALYGEPIETISGTRRMRMIWLDVTPDALRWEWQASRDDGATWRPMMIIEYTRHRAP